MLLPHLHGGPAFLRRQREETTRLVFIRERAHAYTADANGTHTSPGSHHTDLSDDIATALEHALSEELRQRVLIQRGSIVHVRSEDCVLSYAPARLAHFKVYYADRVVHTVLLCTLVGEWAYVANFGCLDRDYEHDWHGAQRLLESLRVRTSGGTG